MESVPNAGNAFGVIGSAGKHTVDAKDRNQLCKQKKRRLCPGMHVNRKFWQISGIIVMSSVRSSG